MKSLNFFDYFSIIFCSWAILQGGSQLYFIITDKVKFNSQRAISSCLEEVIDPKSIGNIQECIEISKECYSSKKLCRRLMLGY